VAEEGAAVMTPTEGTVAIQCKCPFCRGVNVIVMPKVAYENWRDGMHIQDAWLAGSIDDREMLISGTCAECWEKFMHDVEDGDDHA
jgi:hypothetical protein